LTITGPAATLTFRQAREVSMPVVSSMLPFVALLLASDPPEPNRLGLGAGAVIITVRPEAARAAFVALDGDLRSQGIGTPKSEPLPLEFVVELPAETTFERFELPPTRGPTGVRGRHIATLRIEGSSVAPHQDFTLLTEVHLDPDNTDRQRFRVAKPSAVRWVRVTLVDRLAAPKGASDPHHFTELEGYGAQAPIADGAQRFTGRWRHRRAGPADVPTSDVIVLTRKGLEVHGCERVGGRIARVAGHVQDGIAYLLAEDDEGQQRPFTAVVTDTGELSGVAFGGPAHSFYAAPDPTLQSPCTAAPPDNAIADAFARGRRVVLHGVPFEWDSDMLRPDAKPALQQILESLQRTPALRLTIAAHMDAAGAASFLLDLSERRAAAVAHWLVERGIDPKRLEPVGLGGAQPIADDTTTAGQALNRRVEITPVPATP